MSSILFICCGVLFIAIKVVIIISHNDTAMTIYLGALLLPLPGNQVMVTRLPIIRLIA